jgi:NAD(P)-dependent dehydrogenase (short-subunit alcohol dehydrogenase family)
MPLLNDKVAIVTGAGNGVGRATAELFAKEGASVVVNDAGLARNGEPSDDSASAVVRSITGAGGTAISNNERVEVEDGVTRLFQAALDAYGKVDIVINNAGFLVDRPLLKMTDEQFQSVVDVHLKGTFFCTRAAGRIMQRQGSGCIVNTTGTAGLQGNLGQANASAAQGAVYGLTKTASVELQRFGVRVNAVAPLAKTRLTEDLPMFEHVDSMRPEHVAPVHLFLASDLSGKTTGATVSVAGGRLSVFRLSESAGEFKEEDGGIWTAQEIAEHFAAIRKV